MLTLFVKITQKKTTPKKFLFFYRKFPHLHFRMLVKISKFSPPLIKKNKNKHKFFLPTILAHETSKNRPPKSQHQRHMAAALGRGACRFASCGIITPCVHGRFPQDPHVLSGGTGVALGWPGEFFVLSRKLWSKETMRFTQETFEDFTENPPKTGLFSPQKSGTLGYLKFCSFKTTSILEGISLNN